MKPKRPSQYSNHFEIYKEKATCKTCGDVISYAGRQTSGMKRHAEGKHGIKFGEPSSSGLTPPEEKKMKINSQSSLDNFVRIKKRPLEEIVSKEAIKGVSFNYIATSEMLHKGITTSGYKPPKSGNTVRKLVHRSAQNHRKIYKDKFLFHRKNNQRFCVIADEWTCPSKRRKYLNVIIHLKGKFFSLSTRQCLVDNQFYQW